MTHTRTETHEERVYRLAGEALDSADKCEKSRHLSLAITNIEQGRLWIREDMENKGQVKYN